MQDLFKFLPLFPSLGAGAV